MCTCLQFVNFVFTKVFTCIQNRVHFGIAHVYKFVIVVYNNVYIFLKFTCCLHFYSYIFFTYKSLKNLSIFYTLKGVTKIT